jgi:hypothetical protein
MDSSASESEDILQSVLPLNRVSPSRLKPDSLVQGEITNCTSYKDGVASITLKDSSGVLSVQFKGEWAEEAIKKFNKIGKWINFEGKGGTAEAIRDKRGELVLRDNKYKTYRLVYSNGVEGVWNQNAKGPSFFFKCELNLSLDSKIVQVTYLWQSSAIHLYWDSLFFSFDEPTRQTFFDFFLETSTRARKSQSERTYSCRSSRRRDPLSPLIEP